MNQKKPESILVRVSIQEKKSLQNVCQKNEITMSEFIRYCSRNAISILEATQVEKTT